MSEPFERVPDELTDDHLIIRCLIGADDSDLCDGWMTTVESDPRDVKVDGYGRIHFADHIPTECAECGDRVLEYNDVEVTFHV